MLLGHRSKDVGGAYGLLGSMKGAGEAKKIFLQDTKTNLKTREKVRRIIHQTLEADDASLAALGGECVARISKTNGLGVAIATRLLTLIRPDKFISVNDGSRRGLSHLTGLPKTAVCMASETNYRNLLDWLYQAPWYSSPEPQSDLEVTIWNIRAALIDSFVYGYGLKSQ